MSPFRGVTLSPGSIERNRRNASADTWDMETATWFDLALDCGVLEFHEELTAPGPALELHLVVDSETDATIAWWAIGDQGLWLGKAVVGDA